MELGPLVVPVATCCWQNSPALRFNPKHHDKEPCRTYFACLFPPFFDAVFARRRKPVQTRLGPVRGRNFSENTTVFQHGELRLQVLFLFFRRTQWWWVTKHDGLTSVLGAFSYHSCSSLSLTCVICWHLFICHLLMRLIKIRSSKKKWKAWWWSCQFEQQTVTIFLSFCQTHWVTWFNQVRLKVGVKYSYIAVHHCYSLLLSDSANVVILSCKSWRKICLQVHHGSHYSTLLWPLPYLLCLCVSTLRFAPFPPSQIVPRPRVHLPRQPGFVHIRKRTIACDVTAPSNSHVL